MKTPLRLLRFPLWTNIIARSHNSGCGEYVRKVQLMEHWSTSDISLCGEFSRSKFALMLDKKPLVRKCDIVPTTLQILPYSELSSKLADYGLTVNPDHAALLDAVKNGTSDYVPLLGLSLKTVEMPEDSPISIDLLRGELAKAIGGKFVDLRVALLTLPDEKDRNLVARMQSLLRWSHSWRRCPRCASSLRMRISKTAAICTSCKEVYYPPLFPVASCLVTNPEETKALLIRYRTGAKNVFTVISGFAQIGESFEETVRREVAEEVGIECREVSSVTMSVSWPVPHGSLMCAFQAVADPSDELVVNIDEIETAKWFTREEVGAAFEKTKLDPRLRGISRSNDGSDFYYIPPLGSIAFHLIKHWLNL